MANPTPKTEHLTATKWQAGHSGNPAGKPKGTRHISTWISEMLEDEQFEKRLRNRTVVKGAPIKAIVGTLIVKALNGDLRAIELIAKYGYSAKFDVTEHIAPTPIYNGASLDESLPRHSPIGSQ